MVLNSQFSVVRPIFKLNVSQLRNKNSDISQQKHFFTQPESSIQLLFHKIILSPKFKTILSIRTGAQDQSGRREAARSGDRSQGPVGRGDDREEGQQQADRAPRRAPTAGEPDHPDAGPAAVTVAPAKSLQWPRLVLLIFVQFSIVGFNLLLTVAASSMTQAINWRYISTWSRK